MGFEAGSDHKILLSRIYLKVDNIKQITKKTPSKQYIPSKKLGEKIGYFLREDTVPLKLEKIKEIHKKKHKMAATKPKIIKKEEEGLNVFEITKMLLAFVNPKLGHDYYVQQFQQKAKEFYDKWKTDSKYAF